MQNELPVSKQIPMVHLCFGVVISSMKSNGQTLAHTHTHTVTLTLERARTHFAGRYTLEVYEFYWNADSFRFCACVCVWTGERASDRASNRARTLVFYMCDDAR